MSLFILLPFAAAAAAAPAKDAPNPLEAAHKFGGCIVREAPGEVRGLLTMDYQSPAYSAHLASIVNGPAKSCQKKAKGLSVGTSLLAGVMAEELLRARFKPDIPVEQLAPDPRRQQLQARNTIETMALCTVFAAPKASSRLLATEPGSVPEARALDALGPTVNGCLPKGAKIQVARPAMRSLLSLAAWRIVFAERTR